MEYAKNTKIPFRRLKEKELPLKNGELPEQMGIFVWDKKNECYRIPGITARALRKEKIKLKF